MKPKIVILNIYQLGYHTDTYNYCRYLESDFNITYVSFHQGCKDIQIDRVKTISIPQPIGFWNLLKGYIALAKLVKKENPALVFMVYVRFISIVKFLLPRTRIIFDVRTGSLFNNDLKRLSWNFLLRIESLGFKNITIISEGLRKNLYLPLRKCHLIPLGGNRLEFKKNHSEINLLYIGTLDQRNIHFTLEGLSIFIREYPMSSIHYDIIGYGKNNTEVFLRSAINKNQLERIVTFHGRIPYDQIDNYLIKSNVGIVFIPVTSYYDNQPSTKLFEFLLAGIPVLATKTSENKLVVNDLNGILIDDNPDGFSKGLRQISENLTSFSEEVIRETVSDFTWEHIVKINLKPLLFKLLNE